MTVQTSKVASCSLPCWWVIWWSVAAWLTLSSIPGPGAAGIPMLVLLATANRIAQLWCHSSMVRYVYRFHRCGSDTRSGCTRWGKFISLSVCGWEILLNKLIIFYAGLPTALALPGLLPFIVVFTVCLIVQVRVRERERKREREREREREKKK